MPDTKLRIKNRCLNRSEIKFRRFLSRELILKAKLRNQLFFLLEVIVTEISGQAQVTVGRKI
jgi:hypothetical protein